MNDTKTIDLPSGKKATVRPGTGEDIIAASRMCDMQRDGAMGMMMAMVAVKCRVDGQALTFEDVKAMSDNDVWVLIGACQGKDPLLPRIT
jgi:hypothetical protein